MFELFKQQKTHLTNLCFVFYAFTLFLLAKKAFVSSVLFNVVSWSSIRVFTQYSQLKVAFYKKKLLTLEMKIISQSKSSVKSRTSFSHKRYDIFNLPDCCRIYEVEAVL